MSETAIGNNDVDVAHPTCRVECYPDLGSAVVAWVYSAVRGGNLLGSGAVNTDL